LILACKTKPKTTQPLQFSILINPTHQDAIKYQDNEKTPRWFSNYKTPIQCGGRKRSDGF